MFIRIFLQHQCEWDTYLLTANYRSTHLHPPRVVSYVCAVCFRFLLAHFKHIISLVDGHHSGTCLASFPLRIYFSFNDCLTMWHRVLPVPYLCRDSSNSDCCFDFFATKLVSKGKFGHYSSLRHINLVYYRFVRISLFAS